MKHIFLFLFILASFGLNAQVNDAGTINFFDPERDPVALRSDTSLQLLVSEYVLNKAVKSRMGQGCQVQKTSKNRLINGSEYLIFEGTFGIRESQHFTLAVPLMPDALGRFYYTSAQAMVCSSPGCSNCSILNGNCVGCCSSSSSRAVSLPSPLLKVSTTIEE